MKLRTLDKGLRLAAYATVPSLALAHVKARVLEEDPPTGYGWKRTLIRHDLHRGRRCFVTVIYERISPQG